MEPDHTEQSGDDLDVGWGERPADHEGSRDPAPDSDDRRLLDERPPHHDRA